MYFPIKLQLSAHGHSPVVTSFLSTHTTMRQVPDTMEFYANSPLCISK